MLLVEDDASTRGTLEVVLSMYGASDLSAEAFLATPLDIADRVAGLRGLPAA